jgi:cobalt/nickel transport system permease protein
MSRARAARSAAAPDGKGGGSIVWRARVTGGMVGSLFLRSYERSERIYAAMQARGFEGEIRHLHGRSVRPTEYAALVAVLALSASLSIAANVWLTR